MEKGSTMSARGQTTRGAALALAILVSGTGVAEACSTDPYLGDVCMTAANFCPRGYQQMVGQQLPINNNQALYSLMGCQWGGDCRTSFAIPDMRGRAPIGVGQGPGLSGITLGMWRGSEEVTLALSQLPSHSHTAASTLAADVTVMAFDGMGDSPTPSSTSSYLQTVAENPFQANATAMVYGSGNGTAVELSGVTADLQGAVSLTATGGSAAVNIQNPVMAMTYCIATTGTYPPRQ